MSSSPLFTTLPSSSKSGSDSFHSSQHFVSHFSGPTSVAAPSAEDAGLPTGAASGSSTRLQAIARLRRAASNREIKGSPAEPGEAIRSQKADPASSQVDLSVSASRFAPAVVVQPGSPSIPQDTLPISGGIHRPDNQHRMASTEVSPSQSQQSTSALQRSATSSPAVPMSLSRSGSASRADNRSPLPSLEQLRSRILHERLTAGLSNSASASAAARAYAMNKLLGEDASTREGATSPVSDSGHGGRGVTDEDGPDGARSMDEEHSSSEGEGESSLGSRAKTSGTQYLRPPSIRNSAHFRTLRRSRTISGMSQRAEEERKAAFHKDLDLLAEPPSPGGERTARRKKRMSRLPNRQNMTVSALARGDLPASPGRVRVADARNMQDLPENAINDGDEILSQGDPGKSESSLHRQPSQREFARAQMMRKLSSRRLGGRSPNAPGSDTFDTPNSSSSRCIRQSSNDEVDEDLASPVTPPQEPRAALPWSKSEYDPGNFPVHVDSANIVDAHKAAAASIPGQGQMLLTPEQQLAFVQMQQLLQQQQQQLQQAAAAASAVTQDMPEYGQSFERDSIGDSASLRASGDQDELLKTINDTNQQAASQQGYKETLALPRTPRTTRPASLEGRRLGTPISHSLATALPKTPSWDSPGSTSLTETSIIPSMHFTPRALGHAGVGRALPEWPTSPSVSSTGFGESDDADDAVNRRSKQSGNHIDLSSEPDHGQTRQNDTKLQPSALSLQDHVGPDRFMPRRGAKSGLLSPSDAHGVPGSTTPSSDYSLSSPHPESSLSRFSQATSTGDGDHFMYANLLANGGRSSSTLGNASSGISPLPTPNSAGLLRQQQPPPPPPPPPTTTMGSSRSHRDSRLLTSSDAKGSGAAGHFNDKLDQEPKQGGAISASANKMAKPTLGPLDISTPARRELHVDISPSLLKEFGADIDWSGKVPASERHLVDAMGATTSESPVLGNDSVRQPALTERQSSVRGSGHERLTGNAILADPKRAAATQSDSLSHPQAKEELRQPSQQPLQKTPWEAQHFFRSVPNTSAEGSSALPSSDDPLVQKFVDNARLQGHPRAAAAAAAAEESSPTPSRSEARRGPPPSAWVPAEPEPEPSQAPTPIAGVHPGTVTSLSQAPISSAPVYRTMHHRVPSASTIETQTAYANNKLTPFPGLLNRMVASESPGVVTSAPSAHERAASPFSVTSRPGSSLRRPLHKHSGSLSTSHRENSVDTHSRPSSPPKSLFGSLRRKASAAMRNGSLRRKASNITPYDVNASMAAASVGTSSAATGQSSEAAAAFGNEDHRSSERHDPKAERPRYPEPAVHPSSSAQPSGPVQRQEDPLDVFEQPVLPNVVSDLVRADSDARKGRDSRRRGVVVQNSSHIGGESLQSAATAVASLENFPQHGQASAMSSQDRGHDSQAKRAPHLRTASLASVNSSQAHGSSTRQNGAHNAASPNLGEDSLDTGDAAPVASSLYPEDAPQLAPQTAAMLHRYSVVLTSKTKPDLGAPNLPGLTKEDLDSPPRRLVTASPVFQVASASTIKDRYLILFDDILVIAKPHAPPKGRTRTESPDLQWNFVVKNIIELRNLTIVATSSERYRQARKHPLQISFAQAFASDPEGALADVVKRSRLPSTTQTKARFLAQTSGLDKEVLTRFLTDGSRRELLSSFVQAQRVTGVSVESALRSVLLDLRFPTDPSAFEALLMAFSSHWVDENKDLIKPNFSKQLAADLTFAIMALNDAVHGLSPTEASGSQYRRAISGYAAPGIFSEPLATLSKTAFLQAFRAQDPGLVLSDRTLLRIYSSVKSDPLQQSLHPSEKKQAKTIFMSGSGLPSKLVYGVASELVTVSISERDPNLTLRLYGQDLQFDPPVLTFDSTNVRSFRVTSRALGVRHAVFVRAGRSARFYCSSVDEDGGDNQSRSDLPGTIIDFPKTAAFTVERAFMQHSFSLAVPSEATVKSSPARKFLFSVSSAEPREKWIGLLRSAVSKANESRAQLQREITSGGQASQQAQARRAASALALHILRQALIVPDGQAVAKSKQDEAKAKAPTASALNRSATDAGRSRLANTHESASAMASAVHHSRTPSDSHLTLKSGVSSAERPLARNASVSQRYYAPEVGAGKEERAFLSPLDERAEAPDMPLSILPQGSAVIAGSSPGAIDGGDLVTICVQNSILPLVLERSSAARQ